MNDDLVTRLQASLERARRLAELESHARQVVARGERRWERRAVDRKADANAMWIPPGGSATVHGFATNDFVYVGSGLRSLARHDVEPSLIDPSLPVAPDDAIASDPHFAYWWSYDEISPEHRRAYLQWLSTGRTNPETLTDYVRLFLFGLERRVYEFVRERGSSAGEVLAIANETARLLALYGVRDRSFASRAHALLDLILLLEPRSRSIHRAVPQEMYFRLPMRTRILLAEASRDERPIPAALAFEWMQSMHYFNTPAKRCAREFELLFHIRYAQQYGDGMIVKPPKSFVRFDYNPSSPHLDPLVIKRNDLPDVTELARPLAKLVALGEECCSALDALSRFLGKNPNGRDSLAAFALMPDELVEATHSLDANAIADLVRSRLDAHGLAHLVADEVLQYIRIAKPQKIARSEAVLAAQALEKLGYGIEPDVRVGGPAFELGTRAIVFRRLPDCPSAPSDEYTTATICMRLGAIVSAADDEVSERERGLLRRHIEETLQLSPGERQRLGAHLAWLLDAKPGTSGLKKRLDALTASGRHHIGRLLINVATSDNKVDPREMKVLEKLYDLIGLDTADLYADIHAALAGDDEPVVVEAPSGESRGYAIPPPPVASAAGLDMTRVRLKIAETRQVSSLLGDIFAEDDAPPAVSPAIARAGTIGTLDAAHSELLRRLAERETWARDEVERLASELSLLPDGALETINDYAYAAASEPLWEDDDPITIHSAVAMELIR